MDINSFKTSEELWNAISSDMMQGIPPSPEALARFNELKTKEAEEQARGSVQKSHSPKSNHGKEFEIVDSEQPIYDTLREYAKFPITDDKRECIESTVEHLLEDEPNAEDPCLLLGKIQCGKTDTFENIIGYAFDRGIDIAVVLTKGTNALAKQTVARFQKDYAPFKQTNRRDQLAVINIYDIMDVYTGLKRPQVEGKKVVLVCKKEATNMRHLIELFTENSPHLKDKHVLVVDDEADFASRNYQTVKLEKKTDEDGNLLVQDTEYKMAKIAEQIDVFRNVPAYCRYLQVTATPYCLYLQPNGELYLQGKAVKSFRPRFTALVPTHGAYVGGQQYYVESKNEESMYSHLFHAVNPKCLKVLKRRDKRYVRDSVKSLNLYDLRHCIVSYLIGTAIRCIQKEKYDNEYYRTSALIHLDVNKQNHEWQEELINALINRIKEHFQTGNDMDERFNMLVDDVYEDFIESNRKARENTDDEGNLKPLIEVEVPSKEEIIEKVRQILKDENLIVQVVNSDEQMSNLLKEDDGQLELKAEANVFIGGSILDRGITIENMICFFYGRSPKTMQQDTVLQHARMYGARSKEDMAVTRLYTTESLHQSLVRMNDLDEQLRQWFIDGRDKEEPNAVFVGFDKNIKPCASQKIKVSNTIPLRGNKFLLPAGMWTKNKSESKAIMNQIDSLITEAEGFRQKDSRGFFEIDKKLVVEILKLIKQTYVYDVEHLNIDRKSDIDEMLCALEYCTTKSGDKMWCLHRENRNMNRVRQNGSFIDAPLDGHTDSAPAKEMATDKPVIVFLRQNGNKELDDWGRNIGWNNAPFYWPVLLPQADIDPVMFAIDTARNKKVVVLEDDILEGIDPADVLKLTYIDDLNLHFGYEGDEIEEGETRMVTENTASRYLMKDDDGNWMINPKVNVNMDNYQGVYTYNDGVFPFVFRPYKYLLLREGRKAMSHLMLLELSDPSLWYAEPYQVFNEDGDLIAYDNVTGKPKRPQQILVVASDILQDKNLEEEDFLEENICQWMICYQVTKVLREKQCDILLDDNMQGYNDLKNNENETSED